MNKKLLTATGKVLRKISRFTLLAIIETINSSPKEKRYVPTSYDLTSKQKYLLSDKYFFTNPKSPNK